MKKNIIFFNLIFISSVVLGLPAISSAAISIGSCGNLSSPDTTYLLTKDIIIPDTDAATTHNGYSTCLAITAKNITLDCQGHSIVAKPGSYIYFGVSSYNYYEPGSGWLQVNPYYPLTIKNCSISGFYSADIMGEGGVLGPNYNNSGEAGLGIDLFGSYAGNVYINGGSAGGGGGWGGWAGSLRMVNSNIGQVFAKGGYANTGTECSPYDTGGNGGNIYLFNSSVGNSYLSGGGYYNGPASGCGAWGSNGAIYSNFSCLEVCNGSPLCAEECGPSCTYIESVKTWSPCVAGISHATEVNYASNSSIKDSDPACVDVSTIRSCVSCGSVSGTSVSSAPTTNLCSDASSPAVSGTGPWTWKCGGPDFDEPIGGSCYEAFNSYSYCPSLGSGWDQANIADETEYNKVTSFLDSTNASGRYNISNTCTQLKTTSWAKDYISSDGALDCSYSGGFTNYMDIAKISPTRWTLEDTGPEYLTGVLCENPDPSVCNNYFGSPSLNDDLLSMWTFDTADGSNVNTAVDILNGKNGLVTNAKQVPSLIKGEAFDFDGTGDFIQVASPINIDAYTISSWVKFNNINSRQVVVGYCDDPVLGGWGCAGRDYDHFTMLRWADWDTHGASLSLGNVFELVVPNSGYGLSSISTAPAPTGRIFNYVTTFDPVSHKSNIYIDGVKVNTILSDWGLPTNTARVIYPTFGMLGVGNKTVGLSPGEVAYGYDAAMMNGQIDEIGLWKRVLMDEEVKKLYDSYVTNTTDSPPISCSADIIANPLVATCLAISDNEFVATSTVTWMASPSGGTGGPYTYSWTFSGGGTADNVSSVEKIYTVPGYKYATVSISDASTTISVPCTGVGNPGDGDGKGIEIFDPSTITPVLDTALNCTFVTQPLTPVKVNNNATWTISTTPACPSCLRDWTMDSNGTKTPLLVGGASDTLNKIITTTGMKTITAQVFSTNRLKFGNPCIATTTVTQSGVIQEQ